MAGPGDTVVVRNKNLYVNGERFPDQTYVKHIESAVLPRGRGGQNSRDNFGPYVVPPDSYFMMGDNRDNSYDSRYWRAVHHDLILGEALVVHWSWNEAEHPSPEVTVTDPLSVPRLFAYNIGHFFQKVRWGRLFHLIS